MRPTARGQGVLAGAVRPVPSALLTDLFELVMAQSYFELGMHDTAVFELFVRQLPSERQFLIAAGLEQALKYLEDLHFEPDDITYLAGLGLFHAPFLDHLQTLRFTGAVDAMPEGTPFFAEEPILRVTAPILQAQLVESRLLNICHFQSLIASRAARMFLAARGRRLIDYGMRHAHEADAALFAARAAYLAGFDATATVEAGRCFGIPLAGTLAHSFIETHDQERDAFRNFLHAARGGVTLLVDTYDTTQALRHVIELARTACGPAVHIEAVRIDSGNLDAQSRLARKQLDAAALGEVQIIVSGGLDEHGVEALVGADAPVNAFGVGTALGASTDSPALDMAYKLQWYAGKARRKRSAGKATWPGAKQVFRERDAHGGIVRDAIVLAGETLPGEALLGRVMDDGRRLTPSPGLTQVRAHCLRELMSLPASLRGLGTGPSHFVAAISPSLQQLAQNFDDLAQKH